MNRAYCGSCVGRLFHADDKMIITFEPLFGTLSYNHIEFIQDRSLGQAGMPGSAILHHWETLMPLFTVTMKAGRAATKKMRSLVPYMKQASRQDIPTTTCSNVFFLLERADLKVDLNYPGLPKPRTEKMLMIEVLVSSGTDAERKTRLLAALVEALDGAFFPL
jgi:hypothetical protein